MHAMVPPALIPYGKLSDVCFCILGWSVLFERGDWCTPIV